MKNLFQKYVISACIAICLVFSGCSKEKRFERLLYKQDGNWNIDNADYQLVIQDLNTGSQTIKTGIVLNSGIFSFLKGGTGSYNFTIDNEVFSGRIRWDVSDETVSIVAANSLISLSTYVEQRVVAVSGGKTGKKTIELEGSETLQTSDTQRVLTATFGMSKK